MFSPLKVDCELSFHAFSILQPPNKVNPELDALDFRDPLK